MGEEEKTPLPRSKATPQNTVMFNLSAKAVMFIAKLLTKYSMQHLMNLNKEELKELCINEQYFSNAVWAHKNAYSISADQMNPQVPHNLDAAPDTTNQWMKNPEEIAQEIRSERPNSALQYTVSTTMATNPEDNSTFIPIAIEVRQTFSNGGNSVKFFTDVERKKSCHRSVAPREYGRAIVNEYLLQKPHLEKKAEPYDSVKDDSPTIKRVKVK